MPVYKPQIVETVSGRLPQKNYLRRQIEDGPSFTLAKGFSPVALTSGEVAIGSNGAIAVPDHGRLQPIERTALLLTEIHYNIRASGISDPRWSVRTQLSLGRRKLTNGFVPLAGLEYSYLSNSLYGSLTLAGTDFASKTVTGVRWKLPVPLYVPAATTLYSEFQVSSFFAYASIIVDVTYIGRLLPVDYPIPATIKVPYVTSLYGDTSQARLQSKDLELGNPFDVPYTLQRMIMRNFIVNSDTSSAMVEAYDLVSPLVTLRGTIDNVDIEMARKFSHYKVFDDGMTRGVLGTLGHHALNLHNLVMRPKDRFDLLLEWSTIADTPVAVASLIGWRNEVI